MTRLHQLHSLHGQSLWLGNRTRCDGTGDHPVWHRSETDVLPGRHDRREK